MRQDLQWSLHFVSRDLPVPSSPIPFLQGVPEDLTEWLDDEDIVEGTPFLLSPGFEYDVALNAYFLRISLAGEPWNTAANRARALHRFLNFLWSARGGKTWRDAVEADHLAFHWWRRRDAAGPRVSGSTWSQEVALVHQFYLWAVRKGHVASVPIPQRPARLAPAGMASRRGSGAEMVPATFAHDENGERIEWLPQSSYRRWRDVGLRGYGIDGLRDVRFRGRWASRNALFADLMVRTGMRLTEQASLTVLELPTDVGLGGYQRFWVPHAIVKGSSARWIYAPHSIVRELDSYARFDRAEVIAEARAAGRYTRVRRPLVIENRARPSVIDVGQHGSKHRTDLKQLDPADRRRLFIETPDGLEPAIFWLTEDGMPVVTSTWKAVFTTANARCAAAGLALRAHAHLLRHTFAVTTLEQLQRGHIAALANLNPEQRGHYVRIFGDPLDWVRKRLGHASVITTQIYLHALQELEMETRMALVPDTWEDPRDTSITQLGDDLVTPAVDG